MIPDISTANSLSKRIVVIGAGAAGLVAVKTLRSTPEFARGEWEILCLERRRALGGIW
jgi:cation diffusion facilitator CzcD-associated flavoprotein CzcO